ncbi:N-acetylmuramoyl-L-alanine amidase [Ligilactobacillus salivarius]|uniref:N-acetylmuramoyl-L-alanine amidase n=1 Tax=Ligilactobacillus salivarius TaxID=1624 RepID=UPI00202376E1|nr:N-acetylmuramoyl-L-alanine amidase [Ligilactobacillus salivarius]URI12678.1 KxYKxGKxW signal peptide domain-containing protein [Ligilactobacillus salivarius]UUB34503.1 KxYKxGKxW signal peptide domain-containing protein [Ligilactobacillus salivarius]
MEQKTHYKMYKAGKNWVFAMLATVALTGIMAMDGNTAKADTVSQNSTEQVTKVDTTSITATSTQTTNQVEKATNNTNESNTAQTATVTTKQSSSKTATISSNQDNKQAAAASAATSEQNQNAQSTQVANNNEQSNTTQSSAVQKSEKPKVETPVNTANNASQKNVNGNWYLVDNNTGKNLTGFQEIKDQNKVVYYAPSNAQMQYGWQSINNNKYYFDTFNGAMTTGQRNIDGSWYLFDNQGVMQTGFQRIDYQNKTVHYDSNGKMQYGWQWVDNATRYFDKVTGAMTTGQKNINNHWYLFDNKGAMQRGFQNLKSYGQDKTVYYNKDGWMLYGQQKIGGHWYNFDRVTGKMSIGFTYLTDQNKKVYYSEAKDTLGQMQYGWQKINNNEYYFDKVTGAIATGQKDIGGKNYLFDNQGIMQTGQRNINGHWYYFAKDGSMQTGFVYINDQDKTVYYASNGQMQYGQQNISGHWYNFDRVTGKMSIGFTYLTDQNKKVYYSEAKAKLGQMLYGFQTISGKTYYFDKVQGTVATGEKKIDNHMYLFDSKGVMQVGFHDLDGGKRTVYYSEAKSNYGQMLYGNQVINGKNYYFDTTTGAMRKGTLVFDKTNHTLSYVTSEGLVAKNMKYKINNVEYVFNVAGVLEHLQGEANIAGNWYLFDNNNHVLIGFQTLKDGRKVYYSPNNAQMQYGQQNIDGHWYLFDKVNGSMQTGFKDLTPYGQSKTVYYAANGQMQYGKQNIDGHWYLFNTFDGAMYKGWLMSGNDWYYYNQQNGQLQTGSAVINGVGYNFDGNGKQILNYSIDYRYALPAGEGDDETAANNYIILHDVGLESGAAANARYLHDTVDTNESYVTFVVGDGGKVYQVGRPGQVSWGAGRVANHNAPVQIELGRTYNSGQFWQDYVTYVRVARDMAGKYGIPLTLDAGGAGTRGIKSHYWVTKNIWGDHVDPYGYLSRFGVTQAKLAHDLLYGV